MDASNVTSRRSCMGEVYPRLWVGSLQAVAHVARPRHTTASPTMQWTVISILESEHLLQLTRHVMAAQPSGSSELGDSHGIIRSHVEWNLADNSQSNFLSPTLVNILNEMDQALSIEATGTINHNEKAPLSSVHDGSSHDPTVTLHCLVHCARGSSRSVAVCAAWLLSRRIVTTVDQALMLIRTVRPLARPNLGFLAALRALEQCQGDVTAAMERLRAKTGTATSTEPS